MIIKLNNYKGEYRVVSFAKDAETRDNLLHQNLQVLFLEQDNIVFLPDNYIIKADMIEKELLNKSCNYDVFEISDQGLAYKYYDNLSTENAIFITNQCNSNCIMCPTAEQIRRNNERYSGEELINIAKHFQTDFPHITITGGEPFMIKKEIFDLLEYLRNNLYDIDYLLLTNGRAFCDPGYSELFKATRPPRMTVGIPLHGYNSETHDYIVQTSGAFKETILGLKNLLSNGSIVELRIVVSKLNASFITEISRLIVNEFNNVHSVKVMGLEMTGNAALNIDKVWIDYDTAFRAAREGIDTLIKAGIDVSLYNFPLCSVNYNYWNICEKSISPSKIRFAPLCDNCSIKDACGGIFSGTIRLVKDKVKPVRQNDSSLLFQTTR